MREVFFTSAGGVNAIATPFGAASLYPQPDIPMIPHTVVDAVCTT